ARPSTTATPRAPRPCRRPCGARRRCGSGGSRGCGRSSARSAISTRTSRPPTTRWRARGCDSGARSAPGAGRSPPGRPPPPPPPASALALPPPRALRAARPPSRFVPLGAPPLLAFLPQDCVTYATPDALSPLLGGVAFAGLVALAVRGAGGPLRGAAVGLAAAAAVLTKLPNALLAAVALFCAAAARGAPAAPRRGTWTAL